MDQRKCQREEMEGATVIRSSSSVTSGGSLISQKRSSFGIRDRDASFSSYLRPVHDENPRNSDNNNNSNVTIHRQNLASSDRPCTATSSTTIQVDDSTEISIFDAQKYFNELSVVDHHHHQKAVIINGSNRVSPVIDNNEDDVVEQIPGRFSSASSSIDGYSAISRNYRARSFHAAATPTASSEASWNSQTGLLSVPPGTMAVSVRNPLVSCEDHEKKIRSGLSSSSSSTSSFSGTRWLTFRRKCPCSGKKSVQVKDKSVKSKTTTTNSPSPPSQAAITTGLLQSHHVPLNSLTPKSSKTCTILEETRSSMEMEKARTANYKFQDDWGRRRPLDQVHRNSDIGTLTETNQVLVRPKQLQIQAQNQLAINGTSTTTSGFTFPILNANGAVPSSSSATVKLPVVKEGLLATMSTTTTLVEEDPPRDSLEVFRPPNDPSVSSRRPMDYRTPTIFTVPASPKSRTNNDDDVASDASSDLFEIESFSTSTQTTTTATTATYPSMFQYHSQRRDSLDEASTFHAVRRYGGGPNGVMMTNMYCRGSLDEPMTPSTEYCYEPSEASIDWSVTTAEGFDRASVTNASDAEHATTSYMAMTRTATEPEKSRRRLSGGSGLLMSCRCEKAVSVVGPQPVKLAAPMPQTALGGAERVVVGSGSSTLGMWVVGTTAANKTPLARSHSARLSLPFATS